MAKLTGYCIPDLHAELQSTLHGPQRSGTSRYPDNKQKVHELGTCKFYIAHFLQNKIINRWCSKRLPQTTKSAPVMDTLEISMKQATSIHIKGRFQELRMETKKGISAKAYHHTFSYARISLYWASPPSWSLHPAQAQAAQVVQSCEGNQPSHW